MCGITGFISFKQPTGSDVLQRMTNALRHRGPDDEGYAWQHDDRIVSFHGDDSIAEIKSVTSHIAGAGASTMGLGFRRLSIIDLSSCGHQPMFSADGKVVMTFNGEIYNFKELRNQLQEGGYRFVSQSDSEVILAGYLKHGINFIQRLNGMFAIALYDQRLQKAFLIRDRLGIKPLFYYEENERILWASEIKAILASGQVKASVNWSSVFANYRLQAVTSPATCFENIHSVPPGYYLEIDVRAGKIMLHQYWELPLPNGKTKISRQDAVAQLDARLNNVSQHQTISDAPLISLMSGGIDSTTVTALSAKYHPDMHCFTLGFDESLTAFNELPQAQAAAKRINVPQEISMAHEDDVVGMIDFALRHFEEPYSGVDPELLAAKALNGLSYKVAMNGAGADEVFGGYAYYFTWQQWLRRKKFSGLRSFIPASNEKLKKVKGFLDLQNIEQFYAHQRGGMRPYQFKELTGNEYGPMEMISSGLSKQLEDVSVRDAISYLDIKHNIGNHHCVREDLAYMSFSVESRYPFLDHELIEWAVSLPDEVRFSNTESKTLLRPVAAQYISPENLKMPKKGFNLPLAHWVLKQPALEDLCRRKLDALKQRGIFNSQTIDRWWQQRSETNFHLIWMLVSTETLLETYC